MRLKQLLGNFTLLVVFTTTLVASASQLTDVGVQSKDNTTTLTIRANGAFTHTEYRPTDNLLLVDLAGVSAAKLENQTRALHANPGVESYHVVDYKGASGASTTRVELTLTSSAVVNVAEAKNAVVVHISSAAPLAQNTGVSPAVRKSEAAPIAEGKAAPMKNTKPVLVRNVSVSRSKDGLNIEIAGSGNLVAKAIKLTSPDRVVIDIPNSMPSGQHREIHVNQGDVKAIRMAHYSLSPPATRIVVDMAQAHEFELANNGSHVTLKLHGFGSEPVPTRTEAPKAAAVHSTTASVAAPVVAQSAVMVEPTVTTRPATANDIAPVVEDNSAQRAAEAASKFNAPNHDVPVTNVNASMKSQPALNMAMMQATSPAAAQNPSNKVSGCTGNKFTGEPISVNLKDVDLRDFFRLIHEISGLNVVLDPKVTGSLTIVLDDVPWDQALAVVMRNNSLDCQLDGNVLRIATTATMKKEADDRRAAVEAQALAIELTTINRYLSYAVAKDAVPTIKGFLSSRGTVLADERTNALIISDIPTVMPAIDRLIKELDRKTQEVEIEARVVAATRNFARDIGTQFGFRWSNASTATLGTASGGNSPIILPSGSPQATPLPFFSNLAAAAASSGIGLTNFGSNYRLDFILTAAENRGLIKILSRPRIVTQNNIQAVVRQGQRIPVVTGALLGGPPTVTYVDAFLRLTVRPQITAESTIFLNVDVENTTPDFSRVTSTQLNPVLITQQATTQVLVSDGGTVVIGGVIQTQSNVAISQVPLLGNIPVFGNLFKHRNVSTTTQELIFFLTPKIIQT